MKTSTYRWLGLLAFTGILGFSPILRAADEQAPARPARGQRGAAVAERLNTIAKELNLSDEQKTKMGDLLKKEAEKVRTLRQDTSLTPEQRREKMRALRDEAAPEVKKILTTEQYEKWQKMRNERRNPAGGPPAGRPRRSPAQSGNAQ